MRRITRTLAGICVLLFTTAAIAPRADAMSASGNGRVSVHLVNKGDDAQDIRVDGHIYLVKAHDAVQLKVPVGAIVYAAAKSARYQEGEKLITITPGMKDATVYFNCDDCAVAGS